MGIIKKVDFISWTNKSADGYNDTGCIITLPTTMCLQAQFKMYK